MKVIYKYGLKPEVSDVEMPVGVIRSIGVQGKVPVMWVEHDYEITRL